MTAAEKRTPFDESQLFSERTRIFEIFALKSEFRFQPVSDDQYHRLPIFKNERLHRSAANFGWAA
jgi:hypothetical protein